MGRRGARVGHRVAGAPRRRWTLAARRRLSRPQYSPRCRRAHTRLASLQVGRCRCTRERRRSRTTCVPRGRPRQLAGHAASAVRAPRDGGICLQYSTGAPGVVGGAWDYLDEGLVLAGAELVWRAGAPKDEKTTVSATAPRAWLRTPEGVRAHRRRALVERARRFAVHALAQADRIAIANGGRRYSLSTGDVGTALFAAACLDADARYPISDVM